MLALYKVPLFRSLGFSARQLQGVLRQRCHYVHFPFRLPFPHPLFRLFSYFPKLFPTFSSTFHSFLLAPLFLEKGLRSSVPKFWRSAHIHLWGCQLRISKQIWGELYPIDKMESCELRPAVARCDMCEFSYHSLPFIDGLLRIVLDQISIKPSHIKDFIVTQNTITRPIQLLRRKERRLEW